MQTDMGRVMCKCLHYEEYVQCAKIKIQNGQHTEPIGRTLNVNRDSNSVWECWNKYYDVIS